jgi:formamidopyrimidine-DNA glycosylase
MPELPEVEVVRQGISPHILHQTIADVLIRHRRLRFPVPSQLKERLIGKPLLQISRRGKYLLLHTEDGCLLWHLGMSGSLRILKKEHPPQKHDHIDLVFSNGCYLRFNDPRRFGLVLWTEHNPLDHPLLRELGPEPLSPDFTATYLWKKAQKRKVAIKTFIMNSKMVVGVGNIYAAEALFQAKIHPLMPAQELSPEQAKDLCSQIKTILRQAIKQGGTTLKDFIKSDGKPGYFKQALQVYGRAKQPCLLCGTPLEALRLAQRTTVFCPQCQKRKQP